MRKRLVTRPSPAVPTSPPEYEDGAEAGDALEDAGAPLGPEAKKALREARRVAKMTSASARRSERIAEETRSLAGATLETLYHQGQQLEAADRDLGEMDTMVRESESILVYLRKCFVCCDGEEKGGKKKVKANAIDAGPLDVPLALQPASATAAESGSELEDAQRAALGHRAQSSPALESPKTRGISGTQSARFEGVAEPAPPGPEGQGPSASLRSPSLARRTKSRRSRNTFSSSSGRLSSTTLPRLPEGRQMVLVDDPVMRTEALRQVDSLAVISDALVDLTDLAQGMGKELGQHHQLMDRMDARTEAVKDRVEGINKYSKLRKYGGKD